MRGTVPHMKRVWPVYPQRPMHCKQAALKGGNGGIHGPAPTYPHSRLVVSRGQERLHGSQQQLKPGGQQTRG